MPSVYICDDDSFWIKHLSEIINSYQNTSTFPFSLKCMAQSPEELLRFLEQEPPHNGVYFLDLELDCEMHGLELAVKIRSIDPRCHIIFVTSHSGYVIAALKYKTELLDYIEKNDSCLEQRIHKCFLHIEEMYSHCQTSDANTIPVKFCGIEKTICLSDVIYIETVKNVHKVTIHMIHSSCTICSSLSKLRDQAGSHLLQCDQAYLVNPEFIAGIDHRRKLLLLKGGLTCPYSQRMYRKIKPFLSLLPPSP